MKRIMYILGIVLSVCGCSTKEKDVNSSAPVLSSNDANIDYLYSYYDFRKEDPGCEFSGFSCLESFGRWSDGDTSTLNFRVPPMSEITIRLDIDRILCPDAKLFGFNVFANDTRLSHYFAGTNASVYVNVPKEKVGHDGCLRMMFVFDKVIQPSKENPNSDDERKLGFALRGITLYGYSLK